ncbi:MAG: Flp pilus assembly protein CpaB [Elusimicrobiota bacterium]
MKKSLIATAVFGLVSAALAGLYLDSLEKTYKQNYEKTKVLISKQYIDQGMILDESMTEEVIVPKAYIQPRAIPSKKDLVNSDGRRIFMTIVPIVKGEQIVTTKLFMLGMDIGLSAVVPAEKRAVTLVCDRQDVRGLIKPGNRVDIIGVFEYEDNGGRFRQASATILQNILVLSVEDIFFGGEKLNDSRKTGSPYPESAESKIPVSLALTPQEAELLALASEKGIIRFSLRSMGDDRLAATTGAKMQDLLKDAPASAKTGAKEENAEPYVKEMRKKQREALELLNKYRAP